MPMIVKDALGTPTSVETLPARGQAAMAGSLPVAIANDQPALPIADGTAGDMPPSLATNASGIIGWLRKIVDILASATPTGSNTIGAVLYAGSTGADYSVNAASIPMAGMTLLATIAVNPTRAYVEVQNQSTDPVQLVRDDGAGGNASSIMLDPAVAVGRQGGGWPSRTFKGRLRIYGVAGSRVASFED